MHHIINLSNGLPANFEKQLIELKEKDNPSLGIQAAPQNLELILKLIKKHNVLYPVELVDHINSSQQLAVDELIWENQRNVALQLKTEPLSHKNQDTVSVKRTRSRPKYNQSVSVQIDVDVAFQTEVVEELDIEDNIETKNDVRYIPHIDFNCFSDILKNQSTIVTSNLERHQLWYRILGMVAVYQTENSLIDISEDKNVLCDRSIDFDQVKSKAHPMLKGMSESAAEAIAINPNIFVDGLDYHHLPKGFQLVKIPDTENQYTLDFQKTDMPDVDILALSVTESKVLQPVSQSVADTLLRQSRESTSTLLTSAHNALKEKNYNREDLQAFRQNLPLLVNLNADALVSLFNLCHDKSKGHLDGKKLCFYINNQPKLRNIIAHAAEREELGDKFSHISTFCHDKTFHQDAFLIHPWVKELPESNLSFLSSLNDYYQFSYKQLDSLWHLQATRGNSALHQVLNTLQLLKPENGNTFLLFQHVQDLSQLLDAHSWQAACKRLSAMDEAQKAWWEALVNKHMAHTHEDDMLRLVKQFTQFSRHIHSLDLKFYTPVHFDNVRSMSVAITRMLTILNNCQHENLTQQWNCITELPLQASGAIRAIEESSVKQPCSFVTPEMDLSAVFYEFENSNDKGYQSFDKVSDIIEFIVKKVDGEKEDDTPDTTSDITPSTDLDEQESDGDNKNIGLGNLLSIPDNAYTRQLSLRGLYRYLAWTMQKAPLSFYKDAVQNINDIFRGEEWEHQTTALAYVVMGGATTGLINSVKARNQPDQSQNDLIKLMAYLKNMSSMPGWLRSLNAQKWVRAILLGLFALLKVNPDLAETYSLVKLFDNTFKGLTIDWGWLIDFKGKINNIFQPYNIMRPLILEGDVKQLKAFLNSVRFLNNPDLAELTYHLSEIRALGQMLQGSPISSKEDLEKEIWGIDNKIKILLTDITITEKYLNLISLKSQFGISYDNMHRLGDLDLSSPTTSYALGLLTQMTDNQGLDMEQLICFIRALPEPLETDPSQVTAIDYESAVDNETPHHTINYKAVHTLIKETFYSHYNEEFFNNLSDVVLDKFVIDQIKDALPPSVARDTCLKFFKRFPKSEHTEMVTALLILAKQMKEDKAEFVLSLTDDSLFDIKNAHQFKEILQTLNDSGDYKAWLFILRALKRSHNGTADFKLFAKEALTFWLIELKPQLDNIHDLVSTLPANLYNIIYTGFETAYNQKNAPPFVKSAQIWKTLCQELAVKPVSCETTLALITKMINSKQFDYHSLEIICALGQQIEDKTALSLTSYFVDDRIDIFCHLLTRLSSTELDGIDIQLITTVLEKHANANINIDADAIDFLFNEENYTLLRQIYATPPYPSLNKLLSWQLENSIDEKYRQFCLSPCKRNDPGNGFYHQNAYNKALEQASSTQNLWIRPIELRTLQEEAIWAKAQSIEKLKQNLTSVATKLPTNYAKLTAISAELLHRSMGREGNAYELNETQYLAVYKSLRDDVLGPLTGKFDSGEGKTRVFMVIAGAMQAQGKTVDFITRNMTLAKREYMNFQPYFEILGTETAVIHSQSNAKEYQPGQIHFSDVSQFSLFMNQQLSQNNNPRPPKDQRALLLDEADQTYFDAYLTRYNYATTTVNYGKNMAWVYDALIEFFQQSGRQDLYYDNIDACNMAFRHYIANHASELQYQQIQAVSDEQLESWHDAAITALNLSYEHNFNISIDEVINVPGKGRQLYSRAVVVKDNRQETESSYANGVQQCLHARLNWLRKYPDDSKLSQIIATAKHPFVIRPESDIIYFNTSKGFLDDYLDSSFIAFTGTAGSELERTEIQALLGMTFIDFPRHNKLCREELPLRLCRHEDAQFEAILKNIHSLRAANQPVLIICEDDKESAGLTEKLKAYFDSGTITRIHSGCSSEIEQRHADQAAGKAGHITISTDMYARGIDIKLHDQAHKHGLGVLLTYMPGSEREYIQSINRAGRYGCPGTSRMILNKQRLLSRLNISNLPSSFFIHSGVPERKSMTSLNLPKQQKRVITVAITDFQRQLEKVFYAQHFDKDTDSKNKELKVWTQFDKTIRQMWDKTSHGIEKHLSKQPMPEDEIALLVNKYGEDVKLLWQQKFPNINIEQSEPKVAAVFSKINSMKPEIKSKKPVFSHYDRSNDGFAVLYDHWFAETRAWWAGERCLFANTRAWWRGEGILFANFKAWWRGEITLWEYLFPVGLEKAEEYSASEIIDLSSSALTTA